MAKKKQAKADAAEELCFEDALAELEQVVTELESGELGLSQALERYELGVHHLKSCSERLEEAERRIELLSGVDAQGNSITRPLDDETGETLESKGAARSRRRTAAATPDADVDDTGRLF